MGQNRSIGISGHKPHTAPHLYTLVRRVLGALLYSNVFISCCAFSLTVETYKLAKLPVSLPMAVFVFLATLFTYNLSSVQSMVRHPLQPRNRQNPSWAQRHKPEMALLGLASISAAAGLYLAFDLNINRWIMLHLAVISIGYTVPILYKSRQRRPLRSVPLLKVFLIAYVWGVVTALFPLLDAGLQVWEPQALLLFVRRFLFILALALLFDIRDFAYDQRTNTLTIPGVLGVKRTKLLSLLLLLLYVVVSVSSETGPVQLALIASALGAAVVVVFSSENKPRVYYALLADGAMLLHAGLIYLTLR
ncbi:UbiA family prenyltransferase [Pontibacter liquoris]|uniref:UbiA family prenyltransferase n=1 Tax=Pontibacter liquoris TaxID=2905677 RepID=UPI001FA78272|nr:UbiA family prenyltransferase [Pontibacter liquoris]